MHEGWILSEGSVVASAVVDPRRTCGLFMARFALGRDLCVWGSPLGIVLGPGGPEQVDLCLLDGQGVVTRSRRIAGRHVAITLGAVDVMVAPVGLFDANGISPGALLEFREAA